MILMVIFILCYSIITWINPQITNKPLTKKKIINARTGVPPSENPFPYIITPSTKHFSAYSPGDVQLASVHSHHSISASWITSSTPCAVTRADPLHQEVGNKTGGESLLV